MFSKLLIANRGEIACRISRTCRRLGIRTLAVYSEADRNALHVRSADEAVLIGPPPARESYLRVEAIIEAARREGADAIHPGYGFLSENADFAEACANAGIVFVGPPAGAIRAMGSKSEAKALMGRAGVPLVPGYHGAEQEPEKLARKAAEIGFPVLIKASAGGGGKGMRVVEKAADFEAALSGAKREAAGAFGDERVLIERYLQKPRHIEVQVFADQSGECIHLFERDCSLQRRHQKVIEEAPAPGLSSAQRREMGEAACAAARAIGYVGAGTVEFIAEDGGFYFMEMNTRLQVEHPVTEFITGQDLVEWQLRIAAGEKLPLRQKDLSINGHAMEARLYAEDPERDFLPAVGRIRHLRFPQENMHLRIDAGVGEGDEVSLHYDPMIAKVIAWGENRDVAAGRLARALAGIEIVGPQTNAQFLAAITVHPAFRAAEVDTGFIGRHRESLRVNETLPRLRQLAFAALYLLLERRAIAEDSARASHDRYTPWQRTDGWRLNAETHVTLHFLSGAEELAVEVHFAGEDYWMRLAGEGIAVRSAVLNDGRISAEIGGLRCSASVVRDGAEIVVFDLGHTWRVRLRDAFGAHSDEEAGAEKLTAPMPGKIVQVACKAGTTVRRGALLLVLEAMKMEHSILAPADGRVDAIHYNEGELVEEGAELVAFAPTEDEA